jgi:2-C-methyl-D-erythritol 4-phosphate cytidylyltransferase
MGMSLNCNNAAIFLCAGRNTRMHGQVYDKILMVLNGKPCLYYSLKVFLESKTVNHIIFVYRNQEQWEKIAELISKQDVRNIKVRSVQGGTRRQDSVMNALEVLSKKIENIFIHDCARPLIYKEALIDLEKKVLRNKAVCLAHRLTDTIKEVEAENESMYRAKLKHLDREKLWAMETPQVFERDLIQKSYYKVKQDDILVTDDSAAVCYGGHKVTLLENFIPNPKLTTIKDIDYIEFLLKQRCQLP